MVQNFSKEGKVMNTIILGNNSKSILERVKYHFGNTMAVVDRNGKCQFGDFPNLLLRKFPQESYDALLTMRGVIFPNGCNQWLLDVAFKLHKDIMVFGMDLNEFVKEAGQYSKTFDKVDTDNGNWILKADFYDMIVLGQMRGQQSLMGTLQNGPVYQLISDNMPVLSQFVAQLNTIKDILPLDIKWGNILKWCRNVQLGERLDLSCVLINQPLKEVNSSIGSDGMIDKQYAFLQEQDYKTLIDHLRSTRYPVLIASMVNKNWEMEEYIIRQSDGILYVRNDRFMEILR